MPQGKIAAAREIRRRAVTSDTFNVYLTSPEGLPATSAIAMPSNAVIFQGALTVIFNREITNASIDLAAFTIRKATVVQAKAGTYAITGNRFLTIDLTTPAAAGDTLYDITYTATGTNNLTDTDGNDVPDWSVFPVWNSEPDAGGSGAAPAAVPVLAYVYDGGANIFFSRDLTAATLDETQWTMNPGGVTPDSAEAGLSGIANMVTLVKAGFTISDLAEGANPFDTSVWYAGTDLEDGDGTAIATFNNFTAINGNSLSVMVGDSGSGGVQGLVPAPAAGDATKYLDGSGTWSTPAGGPGGSTSMARTFMLMGA